MLITSSMVPRKRRFQPNWFFLRRLHSGRLSCFCFWIAGHDAPRIFAGFALLRRSDPLQKNKKLGIFATFLRLGALLGSFRLEICHFCCVFVPRFAIGELAAIANRKKVVIRTDILFLGSWEGPRDSAGMLRTRCGTGVEPDTVLGRCGPDAERGWIWRGAGLTRCSARVLLSRGAWVLSGCVARVRHRDVAPLPR